LKKRKDEEPVDVGTRVAKSQTGDLAFSLFKRFP
jgi:hypothetical protein